MITEEAWSAIELDLRRQMGTFCHHYQVEPCFVDDVVQTVWIIAHTNYDPSRGKLLRFCTDVGRHLIIDRARKNATRARYAASLQPESPANVHAEAVLGLLRQREKELANARWQFLTTILTDCQYSLHLQILKTMQQHLIMYDEIPNRRQIARTLGRHHSSVNLAVRQIIEILDKEEGCQEEKTPPISSPSGS